MKKDPVKFRVKPVSFNWNYDDFSACVSRVSVQNGRQKSGKTEKLKQKRGRLPRRAGERKREREREREGASSSRGMIWSAGPMHAAPRYNYWSYVSDTQSRMNYRGTTPPASAQPGTTMPAHHEQRPDCRWCVLIVPRGFRPQYPDPVTRFFPPVTRGHSLFLVSSSRTEMKIPYTFTNAYSIQMVSLAKFIY